MNNYMYNKEIRKAIGNGKVSIEAVRGVCYKIMEAEGYKEIEVNQNTRLRTTLGCFRWVTVGNRVQQCNTKYRRGTTTGYNAPRTSTLLRNGGYGQEQRT